MTSRSLPPKVIFIAVLHGSELVQSSLIKKFLLKQNLNKINNIITVSNFTKNLLPKKKINKQYKLPVLISYHGTNYDEYRTRLNILNYSQCLLLGIIWIEGNLFAILTAYFTDSVLVAYVSSSFSSQYSKSVFIFFKISEI